MSKLLLALGAALVVGAGGYLILKGGGDAKGKGQGVELTSRARPLLGGQTFRYRRPRDPNSLVFHEKDLTRTDAAKVLIAGYDNELQRRYGYGYFEAGDAGGDGS